MSDAHTRRHAMRKLIPRAREGKIDAVTLRARLAAMGFDVDLRTIQRDLLAMAAEEPLCSDDARPKGWWWSKDAQTELFPPMDPQMALSFKLIEAHLKPLLPVATLEALAPWFEQAGQILKHRGAPLQRWQDKVVVVPRGQALLPPKIRPACQEAVYDAVLRERQLEITYEMRGEGRTKRYLLHPMGLVLKAPVTYLIATCWHYDEPKQFALHRIVKAKVLDEAARVPEGVSLKAYLEDGEMDLRVGPPIRLAARFAAGTAQHLAETPLSKDQTMESLPDGWVRITATVQDTMALRWWLRGFGPHVEIETPCGFLDDPG